MRHSVIMPVLNGSKHIGEALESALLQLDVDDEVIVIDNGSTDDSMAIVEAIGDPRIRAVSEAIRGPAAARNKGMAVATGELISFLDHDDIWPPGRNAGLLAVLASNPNADAAYGRIRVQFEAGPEPQFDAANGAVTNKIVLGVSIFRALSIRSTGPFAVGQAYGSDVEFLLRYLSGDRSAVAWDGDALIYRRHETNMTRDKARMRHGMMANLASHLARKRGER